MFSTNFIILTIFGYGLAAWLSRILGLVFLKKFKLSKKVIESFGGAISIGIWMKAYLSNTLIIFQKLIILI